MQLYLDSFGAFLSVKNGQFNIRLNASGETHLFAVRSVAAILLTKGTAMSTDAALLAVENDIPVLLIDANTHYPLGQVSSGKPGSIATIRRRQLEFSRAGEGTAWIGRVLATKIKAQMAHLEFCAVQHTALEADLDITLRMLANLANRLSDWTVPTDWNETIRQKTAESFRGQEGTASRLYFDTLGTLLEGVVDFEGRGKRPAYDPFNALLNYLYGMLYTQVHLALLKNGIDPYIGVLHTDRYGGAPVMTFDFIEPYRPWADRVAMSLIVELVKDDQHFMPDEEGHGLWLSRSGKGMVIDAMLKFMGGTDLFHGKQTKRSVQIDLDARSFAAELMRGA